MATRQFIVSGRVQGVGYRAATQARAQQLELAGWVGNLPDGRVEVRARGEYAALEAFEGWLWQGPVATVVEEIASMDVEDGRFGKRFVVRS